MHHVVPLLKAVNFYFEKKKKKDKGGHQGFDLSRNLDRVSIH